MTQRFPEDRTALLEGETVRVYVFDAAQCDPKKCSARRMKRMGLAEEVTRLSRLPRKAILLDPYAKRALSKADAEVARRRGLVVLDCSWERAEETFKNARRIARLTPRGLPFLLPANPVSYGKAGRMSSLEAVAGALFILGDRAHAHRVAAAQKWGPTFLQLNAEPLEEYAAAVDSTEVVRIQRAYLEAPSATVAFPDEG